jgi:hypothetical protein
MKGICAVREQTFALQLIKAEGGHEEVAAHVFNIRNSVAACWAGLRFGSECGLDRVPNF